MGFNNLRYVAGANVITFYWDSISTGCWFPNNVNIYIYRGGTKYWIKNTGGWPGKGAGSATVTVSEGQYYPGTRYEFQFTVWDGADKDATNVWAKSLPYPDATGGSVSAGPGVGQVRVYFGVKANGTWYLDIERNGSVSPYTTPSSPVTQSGLGNGNTYTYRIRVRDAVGSSSWLGLGSVTTFNVPSAPSAPTLTLGGSADTATLKAAWTAPGNGGTAITGYKLYYSTNGGSTWSNLSPGNVTSYTFSNAAKGTAYLVKVAAINLVGEGSQSSQASATTWNYPAAPATPTVTLGGSSNTATLTTSWSAPSNGGTAITGYGFEYSTNGGSTWTAVNLGVVTSYALSNAAKGTAHLVRVRAKNLIGYGSYSGNRSATTWNYPSKVGTPTATAGGTAGKATIATSWSAPGNGGTAITGYNLEYSTNGGSTWSAISPGNVTSYNFADAAKGTTHLIRVAAINVIGQGSMSDNRSVTTWNYPGKATISSVSPYILDGQHYLLIQFYVNDTGGTTLSKQILYRNINGSASTTDLTGSAAVYQQLTPYRGELYKFQISAVNVIGEGAKSNEVSDISRGDNHSTTSTASFGGGGAYF